LPPTGSNFRIPSLLQIPKPTPGFGDHLFHFLSAMHSERGLASATLESYRGRVLNFIIWLQSRCSEFSGVRYSDVEDYLEGKRPLSRSSVASCCSALRIFFRYAEQHQGCRSGIPGIISSSRVPRVAAHLKDRHGKTYVVQLARLDVIRPLIRGPKAILMLLSTYGLRSCEMPRDTGTSFSGARRSRWSELSCLFMRCGREYEFVTI
jgi:site-specific recombinase XerD